MPDDTLARAHAHVSGRVQGVWFRQSTAERGKALGLAGWVRNLADGRVEILAEGPREAVEALMDYARVGPPLADVRSLEVQWGDSTGDLEAFGVR